MLFMWQVASRCDTNPPPSLRNVAMTNTSIDFNRETVDTDDGRLGHSLVSVPVGHFPLSNSFTGLTGWIHRP